MPDNKPEIVLVDDDTSLLKAFSRQIQLMGHSLVSFSSAEDSLQYLRTGRGDVLLLDFGLPDLTGLDVQKQLKTLPRPIPIIFISGQATVPLTVQAIQNGAVTFLEKPVEYSDLEAAIRTALKHGAELRAEVMKRNRATEQFDTLTDRQQEVFQALITGVANKVIARELGISERTVKAHRQAIMERLEAKTIADIYRLASEIGKLPGPPV